MWQTINKSNKCKETPCAKISCYRYCNNYSVPDRHSGYGFFLGRKQKTSTSFPTCAQVQASPLRLAGDITGDCIVDLQDLAEFTLQWRDQGICLGRADIVRDETVNFTDLGKLAHDWLNNNNP